MDILISRIEGFKKFTQFTIRLFALLWLIFFSGADSKTLCARLCEEVVSQEASFSSGMGLLLASGEVSSLGEASSKRVLKRLSEIEVTLPPDKEDLELFDLSEEEDPDAVVVDPGVVLKQVQITMGQVTQKRPLSDEGFLVTLRYVVLGESAYLMGEDVLSGVMEHTVLTQQEPIIGQLVVLEYDTKNPHIFRLKDGLLTELSVVPGRSVSTTK